MKRSNATLMTATLATTLGSAAHAQSPFPWLTDEVLLGSTNGSRSADDVVADPFNTEFLYVAQTGSTSQQGIIHFTLNRVGGQIVGATNDFTSLSSLNHNSAGLKAMAMYDADTLFYALEEGGPNTYGLIGRATSIGADPMVHTQVADLTGVRADGGSAYDPEGIAVDRLNNYLYVMTDDAADQSVAQYTIQGDGSLSATANWSTTIATGVSNGNDGIVLSDGRVAAVAGTTSVEIFAISQSGTTVTNLLGGATSGVGRDTPQDLLEFDGYLYLAWESGIIDAFDLSDLSPTPDASIDLNDYITGGVTIGGLDVTSDGHLIVGTRAAGGSNGEVYAFNAVPEPGSVALLGLGGIAIMARRRRR